MVRLTKMCWESRGFTMIESSAFQLIEDLANERMLRGILLEQGTLKFGPPTDEQAAKLAGIDKLDRLNRLALRLIKVNTWDELLRARWLAKPLRGLTMTEVEWRACTDVELMLKFLRSKVSERKLRYFALACCGRIVDLIVDRRAEVAIEFAEQFADVGVARKRGRPAIRKAADVLCHEWAQARWRTTDEKEKARCLIAGNAAHAAKATLESSAWHSADWASGFSANARAWEWIIAHKPGSLPDFDQAAKRTEQFEQVPLIHDIFGNPFRPVSVDPSWLTSTVTNLAKGIYTDRAFDRLPILADALQDAGCDSDDILNHCRGPGPHVRGCWVVDLLTGRK